MGVLGFADFYQRVTGGVPPEILIPAHVMRRVAIDGNFLFHKMAANTGDYNLKGDVEGVRGYAANPALVEGKEFWESHDPLQQRARFRACLALRKILEFLTLLVNSGYAPIMVWDGYVAELPRQQAKLPKNTRMPRIWSNADLFVVAKAVEAQGIPTIFSLDQGEKTCAMLVQSGQADIVYGNDTDLFFFGIGYISSEYKYAAQNRVVLVCADVLAMYTTLLAALGAEPTAESLLYLLDDALVNVATLMGCDFSPRQPGSGPATVARQFATRSLCIVPEKAADREEARRFFRDPYPTVTPTAAHTRVTAVPEHFGYEAAQAALLLHAARTGVRETFKPAESEQSAVVLTTNVGDVAENAEFATLAEKLAPY